jgi:hypothetical protein
MKQGETIIDVIREEGFTVRDFIPHGGHHFALNIAAGLNLAGNESYPEVFAPFGGFADKAKVKAFGVRDIFKFVVLDAASVDTPRHGCRS